MLWPLRRNIEYDREGGPTMQRGIESPILAVPQGFLGAPSNLKHNIPFSLNRPYAMNLSITSS
jgi:hypothetical protein